jgi:hypothetical protein
VLVAVHGPEPRERIALQRLGIERKACAPRTHDVDLCPGDRARKAETFQPGPTLRALVMPPPGAALGGVGQRDSGTTSRKLLALLHSGCPANCPKHSSLSRPRAGAGGERHLRCVLAFGPHFPWPWPWRGAPAESREGRIRVAGPCSLKDRTRTAARDVATQARSAPGDIVVVHARSGV